MFCAQAVTALMKLADCLLNCLNLLCLGSTFVFFFYLGLSLRSNLRQNKLWNRFRFYAHDCCISSASVKGEDGR